MTLAEPRRARTLRGWGYEREGLSDAGVEDIRHEVQSRFAVGPRRARCRRQLRRDSQYRPSAPEPGARSRPCVAQCADPGRRPWTVPRGATEAAWADAAALPAILRNVDVGRVDRDPLGRPLRNPV